MIRRVPVHAALAAAVALLLLATAWSGATALAPPGQDQGPDAARIQAALETLAGRTVILPQFAGGPGGSLYLVWIERDAEQRVGLFLMRLTGDGPAGEPVRIDDHPGSVGASDLDEGRPSVAVGPGGEIAVAWTGRVGGEPGGRRGGVSSVLLAMSRDRGRTFEPSVVLSSDDRPRSYRGFVGVDVDAAGIPHAAWIDARGAELGMEEPADLFYARVEDGKVIERNLTEEQADSICGCCRIDVQVRDDDRIVIAFRNTGAGYRDVYRIEAGADRVFGRPERLGPQMWELAGCPVSGPLNVGTATLWPDGSEGVRRILAATRTGAGFRVVAADSGSWAIERPPRLVVGSAPPAPLVLLPGYPEGRILKGSGAEWSTAAVGVPAWAMSAALVGGEVVLVGSVERGLRVGRLALDR